jgi:predicted ATPase
LKRGPGLKRYILTGAPGVGKTTILQVLRENPDYAVVDEAATDVIAHAQASGTKEPWYDVAFVDYIVAVQRRRQKKSVQAGLQTQLYDRSPLCTLALARYLGRGVTSALSEEVDRIARQQIYERRVFFIRPIGFCAPTAARRISFEDSLVFERVHQEVYLGLGYELVEVQAADVAVRAAQIDAHIRCWA